MRAKQTEIDECSNRSVVTHQEDTISCLVDLNDLEEYARVEVLIHQKPLQERKLKMW